MPFTRLLVPLDGSRLGEAVLPLAAHLAIACGATVVLLHVVERAPPAQVHGDRPLTPAPVATRGTMRGDRQAVATLLPSAARAALELEHEGALEYLDGLAQSLHTEALSVTTEVRRGDITSALADEAAAPGVGLVVVATHGR